MTGNFAAQRPSPQPWPTPAPDGAGFAESGVRFLGTRHRRSPQGLV